MMLQIVFEDNHLLVVNKPGGALVHGDKTGDRTLLDQAKHYLKKKYNKPGNVFLQPCHRLDRPVSGTLIFARTSKAVDRMNKLFRDKRIEKKYWAVTDKCPGDLEGTVEGLMLLKDRKKNLVHVVDRHSNAKSSSTHYRLIGQYAKYYLWELEPVTGRSHQLRVTMKHLGMPILGDLKYGHSKGLDSSIALHCRSLRFVHPVNKEEVMLSSPVPKMYPWDLISDI